MTALENRIPPPLVLVIILLLMKLLASVGGHWSSPDLRWLAAIFAVLGVGCAVAGVMGFRKAQTTVNPLNPSKASSLVTNGIYRFSRNPMYLGMLFITIAFGLSLSSFISLLGVALFALFITRFQIVPEERAMKELFGAQFNEYSSRTSRWL